MSWLYLTLGLLYGALTLNAYASIRHRGLLIVPSFFAGWLTGELALHHVAAQVALGALLVAAGALDAWPGVVGLCLSAATLPALVHLARVGRRAQAVFAAALAATLGEAEAAARAPDPWSRRLVPFWFFDRRVRVHLDVRYAEGAGRRHLLDVYRPVGAHAGAPVLLQLHGGGWIIGHKRQQGRPLLNHLAAQGWVCVAANYRLSPRARFPEPLIDVKLALRWIREHIAEYGGDPGFVVLTGGSAGGHLAALAALTAGDPRYQPGFESVDTSVRACVPIYGVYDFTNRHGQHRHRWLLRLLEWVVLRRRLASDPEVFDEASPMSRVHAGAPPFCVIHGTHDSLSPVEDARHFVDALRAVSRAPVAYIELPLAQHAFDVFHSARTAEVVRGVHAFLERVRRA